MAPLRRLLAKRPQDRFPDAQAAADALAEARRAAEAAAVLLLSLGIGWQLRRPESRPAAAVEGQKSIAVLPFRNLSETREGARRPEYKIGGHWRDVWSRR